MTIWTVGNHIWGLSFTKKGITFSCKEKAGKKETKRKACPECTALEGHMSDCSLQTREELVVQVKRYSIILDAQREEITRVYERMKDQTTLWQGKFRIVKTENNTLRKKLREQDGAKA